MATHFMLFIFLIFTHSVYFGDCKCSVKLSIRPLSRMRTNLWLTDSAELKCQVRRDSPSSALSSVDIFHEHNLITSQCEHNSTTHSRLDILHCNVNATAAAAASTHQGHHFSIVLSLRNLSWHDRGKWSCFCEDSFSHVNLSDILTPGEVNSLTLHHANYSSPVHLPLEGFSNEVSGLGTRESPLDLRQNNNPNTAELAVGCAASCSFPGSQFQWIAHDETTIIPLSSSFPLTSSSAVLPTNCSSPGMLANYQLLALNCSENLQQFQGVIELMCILTGPQYAHTAWQKMHRKVYLLCQDSRNPSSSWTLMWRSLNQLDIFLLCLCFAIACLIVLLIVSSCITTVRNVYRLRESKSSSTV